MGTLLVQPGDLLGSRFLNLEDQRSTPDQLCARDCSAKRPVGTGADLRSAGGVIVSLIETEFARNRLARSRSGRGRSLVVYL